MIKQIIVLSLFACALRAQDAELSGFVQDPSGAAVPRAALKLVSAATGLTRNTQANIAGYYVFSYLPPGNYELTATAAGFQQQTQKFKLDVAQAIRLDFAMGVGATEEHVVVSAQGELVEPTTSSLGQVVRERQVNNLPLNGRNPLALTAIVPGVVPQGQAQQNAAGTNNSAWGNYQIGGGAANQSSFLLDGASITTAFGHAVELLPSQELIQEFKVQTNNLGPEYGNFAGGVVNLTTKGGTNHLHGSAYEFLRNKVLNANSFFNNLSGVKRGAFTQNQFGATFGGPVYIPRLYDGHNQTFFFVNYEGFRLRQGQPLLLTVPTVAERNGDFRDLRDSAGNVIPLYDPTTTRPDPNKAGSYIRDRIQCGGVLNVICPEKMDPVAKNLTKLWGLPNRSGDPNTQINNWAGSASAGGDTNQTTARMDHNFSDRQRLFARYTYWGATDLEIDPFGNKAYVGNVGTPEYFNSHQAVLSDTYVLSPTTVVDARVDFLRFAYVRTPGSAGLDLTTIGWPSFLNAQISPVIRTYPNLCVSGFNEFCGQETGSVIRAYDDNYGFGPSLSMVRSRHTLKFGVDVRVERQNYGQTNSGTGTYNFDSGFTSSDPLHPAGGNGFASYLLGYASGGSSQQPALTAGQLIYRAFYAGDTWQATSKLAINIGLRYEQTGPWSERHDRISLFLTNSNNPLTAGTALNAKGRVGVVNSEDRRSRNAYDLEKLEFSPRAGLAYRVTPRTVIRTGYGIFWLPNDTNLFLAPDHDVINAFSNTFVGSIDGGLTPYNKLSNPFPTGIIGPPQRSPAFQQILLGQGLTTSLASNPYGYTQQWNFNIQQELPAGLLLDVAYAGAKGTHLPISGRQINYLPLQYLSMGNDLLKQVPNPYFGVVKSGPLAAANVTQGQLLRPFPQYGSVGIASYGLGDSSYNSLQVKAEKRFGAGGAVVVAYTFAKLLADTDTLTSWLEPSGTSGTQVWGNLNLEKSVASFDVPHRLVVSYVLDLPVGRGKKFLPNVKGVVGALVSGWGADGITTFQSGFPLFLGTSQNLTQAYGGGSRPNFNAAACPNGPSLDGSRESRRSGWFKTACFTQPAPFTFGNVSRTTPYLRTDGVHNFDFSMFKNTTFGLDGRYRVQFRAEFFNLFNTPQFGYPGMTLGTPQFGVVTSQANNPRLVQFGLKAAF